jgi:hypothetical protein
MKYLLLFLVACGGSPSGTPIDGSVVDMGQPSSCGMVSLDGVKITSLDPLGFPAYAADGCKLAYVAKDGTLVLRDLQAGTEVVVATPTETPRRPSLGGPILAWEATVGGMDVVRWRSAAGVVETIPSTGVRAGEPHAATDAIAFTMWATADMKGDTDVMLFSLADKSIVPLGDGPAQQRFADISATHVAWADFSEGGPTGAFEADIMTPMGYAPADIVVYDRASKTKLTRKAPAKQAFPMLVAGGKIAYLDWNQVRPQPKLFGYAFKAGAIGADPTLDSNVALSDTVETTVPYIRPSVRGDSYWWLQNGGLWHRPTDLSVTAQRVDSFNTNAYTIVAIDGLAILAVGNIGDLSLLGLNL